MLNQQLNMCDNIKMHQNKFKKHATLWYCTNQQMKMSQIANKITEILNQATCIVLKERNHR